MAIFAWEPVLKLNHRNKYPDSLSMGTSLQSGLTIATKVPMR